MSPGMHSMMASTLFICSLAPGILPAPLRAQAPEAQSGAIASINALQQRSCNAWKALTRQRSRRWCRKNSSGEALRAGSPVIA
jgi:hypothetical protein